MAKITTLRDLLIKELGVETYERETSATAGVNSSQLLRQNGSRIAFVYMNLSTGDTHRIRPRKRASTTEGLIVGPGEWRSFLYREDFTLVGQEWHVISSAAGSAYYMLELLLMRGRED